MRGRASAGGGEMVFAVTAANIMCAEEKAVSESQQDYSECLAHTEVHKKKMCFNITAHALSPAAVAFSEYICAQHWHNLTTGGSRGQIGPETQIKSLTYTCIYYTIIIFLIL